MQQAANNFVVYQASAGSGKTFTLVLEYLKIVLTNPEKNRRILAVTFTNKAAFEMKSRIMDGLALLSKKYFDANDSKQIDKYNSLLRVLMEHITIDEPKINERATLVLQKILHHYSDFAVCTIDSFVHRIIRTFAFDLKIPQNFDVELDAAKITGQAVDILLSMAGIDDGVSEILVDFAKSKMADDKSWDVEKEIKNFARELSKENASMHLQMIEHISLADFKVIIRKLYTKNAETDNTAKQIAKSVLQLITHHGLTSKSFFQGDRGIYGFFNKIAHKGLNDVSINSYCQKTINEDMWYTASTSIDIKQTIDGLKLRITADFQEIETLRISYINLTVVKENIYPLSLLSLIHQEVEAIKNESGIIFIGDFYQKIHEQLIKEPVPFIYQRVGEKYENIFMDEFQDTSVLQFQNMLPLIENSLASGNLNLIVGDGKQAIYRWRNGEVRQFVDLPAIYNKSQNISWKDTEKSLERNFISYFDYNTAAGFTNFRSKKEIVEFNNTLYAWWCEQDFLDETTKKIYTQLKQQVKPGNDGGYVKIAFIDGDNNYAENQLQQIFLIIKDAMQQGANLQDIAVICRKNKEVVDVASSLLAKGIPVLSSESLMLKSSDKVCFLVSVLRYLADPKDAISLTFVLNYFQQNLLFNDDLHSILELFKKKGKFHPAGLFEFFSRFGYNTDYTYISGLAIYDLNEEIIRLFQLNKVADPFLLLYLEILSEYLKNNSSDLTSFINWYDEVGATKSIHVPDGMDAVKIMTIHASKGQEFPVVIFPFADENARVKNAGCWVQQPDKNVPELPAVLISVSESKLAESDFFHLYTEEKSKCILDMMNLCYVATTRAQEQLYILSNKDVKDNISFGKLLAKFLSQSGYDTDSATVFEFGKKEATVSKKNTQQKPDNVISLTQLCSNPWQNRIMLKCKAEKIWDENRDKNVEWGKCVHAVLSQMKVTNDLPMALERSLREGLFSKEQAIAIENYILKIFENKEVLKFFDPGLKTLSEAEILTPDNQLFRPDRIILYENHNCIIDYKTGKPEEKHKTQLQQYAILLTQINGKPTQSYLLYLENHGKLLAV